MSARRTGFQPAIHSYAERPELWEDSDERGETVWPEYNRHGDVVGVHWPRLFDVFPEFQLTLCEPGAGDVLAEVHTAPVHWDGTSDGLGSGIDEMLVRAVAPAADTPPANALCAMAAEVTPAAQGRGLAGLTLEAMGSLARGAGLAHLIAPVRPSLKELYPLVPIDRYVRWVRDDGEPFDPWLRVHVRRGGRIDRPIPQSMRITGTIGEWERWVGMRFPDDGEYTFPRGLAPVAIETAADRGSYWEPNVWVVHPVS